ncbi:MAG: lipoprotein [Pseudomonadales bacterium]|jgi:predicted small lipoprotein YifL|nr:lipoprotein [Pseudomonadales bacterium]
MRANRLICALFSLFVLAACGQKGDLYLEQGALEQGALEQKALEDPTESTRQGNNTEREQADK